MKPKKRDDYAAFKAKIIKRFFGIALLAFAIVVLLYLLVWQQRGGDWIVGLSQSVFGLSYEEAFRIYHHYFRGNKDFIFGAAIIFVFLILLRLVYGWIIGYFKKINQGINALLMDDVPAIHLPTEMLPLEQKLNTVKGTLKQRELATQLAEQRKNDLVMYLAHDIRTPLTSVIGYLNLLEAAPDMPTEQKAKYVHIALEKAYRLEKMVNEFFEITRYNLQQISIAKEPIDLYYLLVQLSDELSPVLAAHGNSVVLNADENLTAYGDGDKLARAFSNILKNAAAYSDPNTEIRISAAETGGQIAISFTNKGKTIPEEKLSALFEKFCRLDEARASDTGGTGLGLAITKEIISLHGGTISAASENDTVTFSITLPIRLPGAN